MIRPKIDLDRATILDAVVESQASRDVLDELRAGTAKIVTASVIPSEQLHAIYETRLRIWRERSVPGAADLAGFVMALGSLAASNVTLVGCQSATATHLLVLSEDLSQLHATFTIREPPIRLAAVTGRHADRLDFSTAVVLARDDARPNDGWLYEVLARYGPGETVPPEAIRKAWKVSGGALTGDFESNPGFLAV